MRVELWNFVENWKKSGVNWFASVKQPVCLRRHKISVFKDLLDVKMTTKFTLFAQSIATRYNVKKEIKKEKKVVGNGK